MAPGTLATIEEAIEREDHHSSLFIVVQVGSFVDNRVCVCVCVMDILRFMRRFPSPPVTLTHSSPPLLSSPPLSPSLKAHVLRLLQPHAQKIAEAVNTRALSRFNAAGKEFGTTTWYRTRCRLNPALW